MPTVRSASTPDASCSTLYSAPIGLEFGPGGSLYVASLNNNKVAKFDGTTGASQGDFVAPGSGVSGPNFFTFLPEPGVLVALISGTAILLARRRRASRYGASESARLR